MSEQPEFIPSPQQADYFNWLQTGRGSLVLEACAGAGKSTTLIQGLQFMHGSVFLGAYNKAAANDLKAKADKSGAARKGVFISTMHAAGFGAWRRAVGEAANSRGFVNERKTYDIIDAIASESEDPRAITDLAPFVSKMVSLGLQMLCGVKWDADNLALWTKIAEHFGTTSELPETTDVASAMALVARVFRKSADACRESIDFDQMIWAPLAYNAQFFKNDWVVVDECQDFNPARRELARRMLKSSGRLVAVGDSLQSIYGFQGADSDAVDLIIKEFNCVRMPLSVTYRCPQAVVRYAHNFVPSDHIQAHESAPEGAVRVAQIAKDGEGNKLPWFTTEPLSEQDAVLCRYTKPLVTTAFGMIRAGIACRIEGRDIGQGLIQLAQRWKVRDLDRLETKLDTWLEREVRKAKLKKSPIAEQSAIDRRDTLQVFIERCRAVGKNTIECLVAEITALFADNVSNMLTLCTGHRSKGREWNRVFQLQVREFERPGMQEWMKRQELNVAYVMATRAMQELVLIPVAD